MRTTLALLLACAALSGCAGTQQTSAGAGAGPGPGAGAADAPARPRRDPNALTREEITAARVENTLLLLQRVRQGWLRTRTAMGDSPGRAEPADVVVYLDSTRMGGPETLRGIPTSGVQRIEYVPGIQAERRWGYDHREGAILVTTGL